MSGVFFSLVVKVTQESIKTKSICRPLLSDFRKTVGNLEDISIKYHLAKQYTSSRYDLIYLVHFYWPKKFLSKKKEGSMEWTVDNFKKYCVQCELITTVATN